MPTFQLIDSPVNGIITSSGGAICRWLPARAHDNGLFILFSNGVGADDDEVRTGNAMILDPYGRIINETWAAEDFMVTADLDLSLLAMSTGRRWIHGRRPDLYHILTQPQGYERDAISARFSDETPYIGSATEIIQSRERLSGRGIVKTSP